MDSAVPVVLNNLKAGEAKRTLQLRSALELMEKKDLSVSS